MNYLNLKVILLDLLDKNFNVSNSINFEGNYTKDNLNSKLAGTINLNKFKDNSIIPELQGNVSLNIKTKCDKNLSLKYKNNNISFHLDNGLFNVTKNSKSFTVNPYFSYDYSIKSHKSIIGFGHILNLCSHFIWEVK